MALSILSLTAGCADGASGGPLDGDYGAGLICWPQEPGSAVTIGQDILQHRSDDPVVIEDVRLAEPTHGLELIETRVAQNVTMGFGSYAGFPPTDMSAVVTEMWNKSVPAVGATVPAATSDDPGDQSWTLVVGLRFEEGSSEGVTQGLEVHYRVGRETYVYTTPTRYHLTATTCDGVELRALPDAEGQTGAVEPT